MASDNPFGIDPEDFDRFAREAGDGLRELMGKFLDGQGGPTWSTVCEAAAPRAGAAWMKSTSTRPAPEPETAGESGAGVWAVFLVDADGGARVEQVYATELEALRANARNTDPSRQVRFLPYGITVSALDHP